MGYQDGMWDGHLGVLTAPQAPLFSRHLGGGMTVGRAAQTRQISHVIVADRQEIKFPLPPPQAWGLGTAKEGWDNSICEMHSRGLPVSARKMSGAKWSGVTEYTPNPTDALHQDRWLSAGVGRTTFILKLICRVDEPTQDRRIEPQGSELTGELRTSWS